MKVKNHKKNNKCVVRRLDEFPLARKYVRFPAISDLKFTHKVAPVLTPNIKGKGYNRIFSYGFHKMATLHTTKLRRLPCLS